MPALLLLTGCNWVMNVSGLAAESNKAIGASCRQTGRSLEECYSRNPDADKAQIFAGWREMQDYMAKNKLETMVPPAEQPPPVASAPAPAANGHADATAQKKSSYAVVPPPQAAVPPPAAVARAAPPARKPLTNAEAEAMAKNDPLIDSILSTVRGNEKPKPVPRKDEQATRDNRLLNILSDLNSSQSAAKAPQEHPAAAH
ncbi:hypothetical protein [Vogesella oryzae]|uniref:hypothetical protein n=1 Tax=Vogesella oryzae TaxID=1735285 RepID=UPI001582ED39|nr:hypothetical protein [Vogesella oryzae]